MAAGERSGGPTGPDISGDEPVVREDEQPVSGRGRTTGTVPSPPRTKRGIGDALASARTAAGLSYRELGRRSKVPPGTLQGWIGGRSLPTPALRQAFFDVLDILGLGEQYGHEAWWAAVEQARHAPAVAVSNPYVGLRAYGPQDCEVFFGRDAEIDELARRVVEASGHGGAAAVVALVGPSGSGKSSLLGAGLLGRACAEGGALDGWFTAQVSPGQQPAEQVRAVVEQCRAERGDRPAVLVVDQFEELWTVASEQQRREALGLLWSLLRDGYPGARCAVVVALRSDFFGQAAELELMRPALGRAMLLRSLERDQAQQMITGPARTRGVTVDPGLVAVLERDLDLDDGSAGRGALPLLSQALTETWDRAAGPDALTVGDYLAAGGTAGAVERAAERAYAELTPSAQGTARELLLRLVRVDLDVLVRRPLPLEAVQTDEAWAVVERFARARLVTVTEDCIELAHETLLHHWPRLQAWVAENVETLQAREYLARATALWLENGCPDDLLVPVERFGLHRSTPEEHEALLSSDKREFVAASRAHFAARELEQIRINARLRRRHRIAVVAFAVAAALAVIAGVALVNIVTIRNQALSRQLALSSERVARQNPGLAAQIALASSQWADTVEGTSALVRATGAPLPRRQLGPAVATSLVVGRNGDLLVQLGGDGTLRIWRAAGARGEIDAAPELVPLDDAGDNLFAGAVVSRPDGRTLLTAGGIGGLWLVEVGAHGSSVLTELGPAGGTVYSAAFTPDGNTLVTGSEDGTVRRWDVSLPESPRELPPLGAGEMPVLAVAVSPDGALVAASDETGVRVWDLDQGPSTDGAPPEPASTAAEPVVLATSSRVQALAISPDGRWLAAGEAAGRQVALWSLDGSQASAGPTLTGFSGWVNDVAFSADTSRLVAASSDQTMRVFSLPEGVEIARHPHPAVVSAADVVGDRLVSASSDGSLQWWPPGSAPTGTSGRGLLQLSADGGGERLAAAADGTGALFAWDLADPARPRTLPGPQSPPGATGAPVVAVLPDGSGLLGGSVNGDLHHWQRQGDGFSAPSVVPVDPWNMITVIVPSADGRTVVASSVLSDEAFVLVRRGEGYEVTSSVPVESPQSMALAPDGRLAAIPDVNGEVGLWHIDDRGIATPAGHLPGQESFGSAAVFHPTDPLVAIGTDAGDVALYDVSDPAAPRPLAAMHTAEGALYGLSFSPDGSRLAGGAGDEHVWIWSWDGATLELWAWIDAGLGRVNDVRFVDDGRRVIAVGADGGTGSWDLDLDRARRTVCESRGVPLTEEEWDTHLVGAEPRELCGPLAD